MTNNRNLNKYKILPGNFNFFGVNFLYNWLKNIMVTKAPANGPKSSTTDKILVNITFCAIKII
jgi:hypothetical protein